MAKDVLLNVYGCYNGALKRELTNFQSFTMQTAKAQQKKKSENSSTTSKPYWPIPIEDKTQDCTLLVTITSQNSGGKILQKLPS